MASTQSGRTTASTSANTFCLTAISSNTASITKSASANASLVSDPVTRPVSRAAASAVIRPRLASLAISPCTWPTPASSRAWSRSVSTTGTSSLRANSSAICAAIRPAPTTPTLVTGRASDTSGAPAACRARFWVRSNAYRLACSSSLSSRSASPSSSAAKPSSRVRSRAAATSSMAR